MRNKGRIDVIFVLIAIVSLLYIRQYEAVLYYKATPFMNMIYIRVAIPFFYYFLAAYIMALFIDFISVNISDFVKKISVGFSSVVICLYFIVIILELFNYKILPYYGFISKYCILFAVSGCLFALAIKANLNKNDMKI